MHNLARKAVRSLAQIALALVVALAAAPAGASPDQAKHLRIAMILWHDATPAEAGFQDELKKLGYQADYVILNAHEDRSALRSKLEEEILPQITSFDYIYTYGTTVSKLVATLVHGRIPQLFVVVYDPVGAGLVKSLEEPGGNISGASDAIPLPVVIESASKVFAIKKLGLLYNPREKNSDQQREKLQALGNKKGFDIVDLRSPPALDMLQQNLQKLADGEIKVDAVFLPADSFLFTNASLIGAKLIAAKVKSLAVLAQFVDHGALMGVGPSYQKLGEATARMIDETQKGKPLGRIPVYVDQEPTLVINATTAAALGLEIPASVRSKAVLVNGPPPAASQ